MTVLGPLPGTDPAYFLKIAGQGAGLQTHADFWRSLQGDVQKWLAHDVMLIGWGDFRPDELRYDVVSGCGAVPIRKLDVTNRARAVAKLTRIGTYA